MALALKDLIEDGPCCLYKGNYRVNVEIQHLPRKFVLMLWHIDKRGNKNLVGHSFVDRIDGTQIEDLVPFAKNLMVEYGI